MKGESCETCHGDISFGEGNESLSRGSGENVSGYGQRLPERL
jgi:hypothetical protein